MPADSDIHAHSIAETGPIPCYVATAASEGYCQDILVHIKLKICHRKFNTFNMSRCTTYQKWTNLSR